MKETFMRLPDEKRLRIINAGISEFGSKGYEHGSLDRIVKSAGISKGGLYEYISSKEELFLFLVDLVYNDLYRFLEIKIHEDQSREQKDILGRLFSAVGYAAEYYFENVDRIRLLERNSRLEDPTLLMKISGIFRNRFDKLFFLNEQDRIAVDAKRLIDLLRWILLKTRSTFLLLYDTGTDHDTIRDEYLEEWRFHLSVLKKGIYENQPFIN